MMIINPPKPDNKDKKMRENEDTSSTETPPMDNVEVSNENLDTNKLQAMFLGWKYSRW